LPDLINQRQIGRAHTLSDLGALTDECALKFCDGHLARRDAGLLGEHDEISGYLLTLTLRDDYTLLMNVVAVPEPAATALLVGALILAALLLSRRR
jgi:hypothetical protein